MSATPQTQTQTQTPSRIPALFVSHGAPLFAIDAGDDHFLPIFFALGAAGEDLHANYLSREVMYSMLSMDAFALQPVH